MSTSPKNKKPEAETIPLPGEGGTSPAAAGSEGSNTQMWFASLEKMMELVFKNQGPERSSQFLFKLITRLRQAGIPFPHPVSTPYVNTIPVERQPPYPGDLPM